MGGKPESPCNGAINARRNQAAKHSGEEHSQFELAYSPLNVKIKEVAQLFLTDTV